MTRPLRPARRALAALLHAVSGTLWFVALALRALARRVEPRPEPAGELEAAPAPATSAAEPVDPEPPAGRQLTETEQLIWRIAIHRARHHDVPRA